MKKHLVQMKEKRPLRKSLIIFSGLLLLVTNCATKPYNPRVSKGGITFCVLDVIKNEGICGRTGEELNRVPLVNLDRSVSFAPSDWEKMQNYIDFLEFFYDECINERK